MKEFFEKILGNWTNFPGNKIFVKKMNQKNKFLIKGGKFSPPGGDETRFPNLLGFFPILGKRGRETRGNKKKGGEEGRRRGRGWGLGAPFPEKASQSLGGRGVPPNFFSPNRGPGVEKRGAAPGPFRNGPGGGAHPVKFLGTGGRKFPGGNFFPFFFSENFKRERSGPLKF